MFICARIIAGLGIGFINSIIPSWVSELSQAQNRGSSFSLIFIANLGRIVLVYWINYGIRNSNIIFRWRFPLGFMIVPMFIVAIFVIPILLQHLGWANFVFFSAPNIVASPIIYFFYPETANRSLEEMNLIFTADSWLVSENMKEYDHHVETAGGNIAVAAPALLDEVDGETHLDPGRIITLGEEGANGDRSISSIHDEIHEKV
ncbi:hypothetical protein BKA61DRAFT_683977 [Leptodontidium sp. MPI-SDFR-AT-0119]|nr:hypothetical protein BKA61DRAFT_683977 [Leptodontidium sp. MPI-SDFR-AT-0119]